MVVGGDDGGWWRRWWLVATMVVGCDDGGLVATMVVGGDDGGWIVQNIQSVRMFQYQIFSQQGYVSIKYAVRKDVSVHSIQLVEIL
jgi:hypothetical protein